MAWQKPRRRIAHFFETLLPHPLLNRGDCKRDTHVQLVPAPPRFPPHVAQLSEAPDGLLLGPRLSWSPRSTHNTNAPPSPSSHKFVHRSDDIKQIQIEHYYVTRRCSRLDCRSPGPC